MVYNPEIHDMNPKGFIVHKKTGHYIGLEEHPLASAIGDEFPKWVAVHASHIVRLPDGRATTPMFCECHVHRDTGEVTVLVHDEEEERRAVFEAPLVIEKLAPADPIQDASKIDPDSYAANL